jgi:dUTP pyrophosphatase
MSQAIVDPRIDSLFARIERLELAADERPLVKFKKLHADAQIPKYQTAGAAGLDLVACNDDVVTIFPDAVVAIPVGLAIELPKGFEAQVRPRSGLSLKGVAVANSPGTIDEDFRGEICVIIRNHGKTFIVRKGDRIAQLVIARAVQAEVVEMSELSDTVRGAAGFGSTGTK